MVVTNHFDNGNNTPYSEEIFNNVNVTLNHYAIRNLEDYEKKKTQLDCVHSKFTFITGLLDMLNLDDSFFVTDDSLAN